MKISGILINIGCTIAILFILAGFPILKYLIIPNISNDVDAVSSSSLVLPEQPSGDFLVFINESLHEDSVDSWEAFFMDEEFSVIFEDIGCLVAEGDAGGIQLAERFQAELPENQMKLKKENPVLVVSRIEEGYIDVAIISKEMAESLKLLEEIPGICLLHLSGS